MRHRSDDPSHLERTQYYSAKLAPEKNNDGRSKLRNPDLYTCVAYSVRTECHDSLKPDKNGGPDSVSNTPSRAHTGLCP